MKNWTSLSHFFFSIPFGFGGICFFPFFEECSRPWLTNLFDVTQIILGPELEINPNKLFFRFDLKAFSFPYISLTNYYLLVLMFPFKEGKERSILRFFCLNDLDYSYNSFFFQILCCNANTRIMVINGCPLILLLVFS